MQTTCTNFPLCCLVPQTTLCNYNLSWNEHQCEPNFTAINLIVVKMFQASKENSSSSSCDHKCRKANSVPNPFSECQDISQDKWNVWPAGGVTGKVEGDDGPIWFPLKRNHGSLTYIFSLCLSPPHWGYPMRIFNKGTCWSVKDLMAALVYPRSWLRNHSSEQKWKLWWKTVNHNDFRFMQGLPKYQIGEFGCTLWVGFILWEYEHLYKISWQSYKSF